jgi:transposase
LFGLEHEFSVLEVRRVDARAVKVIIEQAAREGPCPECGVFSGTVKDRPVMRLKDLPIFGQSVELWCRKRRLICEEALCPRRTFTQVSTAVSAVLAYPIWCFRLARTQRLGDDVRL